MRQVIHALLTRPPLSHNRIIPEGNQLQCFVRLACVKHAASVHPEPGSNSLIKFNPNNYLLAYKLLLALRLIRLYCVSGIHYLLMKTVLKIILFESFKVISLFSYQGSLFVLQLVVATR